MKRSIFQRLAVLIGCLLLLQGASGLGLASSKSAFPTLTEDDLSTLDPARLPLREGVPILPLYSISASVAIPNTHSPDGTPPTTSPTRPKVGIQIGHLNSADFPAELAVLRSAGGASQDGLSEVKVCTGVANRLAALLKEGGVEVDILPANVPVGYAADAFVALHSDWSPRPAITGFKLARSRYSSLPEADDRLMELIYSSYEKTTGLTRDWNITSNMTGYYAFNNRKYQFSLNRTTPSTLIELGFLTNNNDRQLLANQQDILAKGISQGLMAFLKESKEPRVPLQHMPTLLVGAGEGGQVPVYDTTGKSVIAYVASGQQFAYYEREAGDGFYTVWLPVLNRLGRLKTTQGSVTTN